MALTKAVGLDNPWASFKEPGQSYEGIVVSYDYDNGAEKYGSREPCGLVEIRETDGSIRKISLDNNTKRSRIMDANLFNGQWIRMVYTGEKPNSKPGGKPWKDYEVFYDEEKDENPRPTPGQTVQPETPSIEVF